MISIQKNISSIFLFIGLLGISQFTWAQSINQKAGSKTTFQVPYTIYDHSSGSNQMRGWIGGTLGIELF